MTTATAVKTSGHSSFETNLWWVLTRPICLFVDFLMIPGYLSLLIVGGRVGPLPLFVQRERCEINIDGMDMPLAIFSAVLWMLLTLILAPIILICAS